MVSLGFNGIGCKTHVNFVIAHELVGFYPSNVSQIGLLGFRLSVSLFEGFINGQLCETNKVSLRFLLRDEVHKVLLLANNNNSFYRGEGEDAYLT